jgi:hypothetical protein
LSFVPHESHNRDSEMRGAVPHFLLTFDANYCDAFESTLRVLDTVSSYGCDIVPAEGLIFIGRSKLKLSEIFAWYVDFFS